MNKNYYAVIVAGGEGTRLWPLSRRARPKHMLRLARGRTLFQMAIDRLDGLFPPERIFVVTVAEQAAELKAECPQIPEENYLLEPQPRGTASAIGLAAVVLQHRDAKATMAVLTADHFIEKVDNFHDLLRTAYDVTQDGYLVTMGIKPLYPATGYGYIQQGEVIKEYQGHVVHKVLRFREKPDAVLAQQFIDRGDHLWNSGMFIWRNDLIISEFQTWMPQLTGILMQIKRAWGSEQQDTVLKTLWPSIKPETIDYGIMEKSPKVAVIPAVDLGWNDVGSWDSLFDVLQVDENGNIIIEAQHVDLDTTTSLICAEQSRRLIATIGLKDLVIVDTGDILLVCPRSEAQRVKQLVGLLKQTGHTQYL